MGKLEDAYQEVWEKTEWLCIATSGEDGPHLAGAWGEHLRLLNGALSRTLLVPAGRFHRTEANLKRNPRIEVMLASRRAEGPKGPGQGCTLIGTAAIESSGPHADRAKQTFTWARGALVIQIEREELHL